MAIRRDYDKLTPSLNRIVNNLGELPQQTYEYVKSITPKRSGAARKNTVLRNKRKIEGAYNYSQHLDDGASSQAPQGMSKPAKKFLANAAKKVMRK